MSEPDDTDVFSELGVFVLTALFALVAAFLAGWFTYAHFHPGTVQIVHELAKPLTYDEQHLLAIDFMADNPHARYQVCRKDFSIPMDSDGGVK